MLNATPRRLSRRHAERTPTDSAGVKLVVGRGYYGPTVNLIGSDKSVELSEEEKGWTSEPHTLKPGQFARLELEKRYISLMDLPPEAVEAFKGTKSRFGRHEITEVYAVIAVVVSRRFRGQGYGLALYLKALELASSRGYWLVNDTKRSTTESAYATWQALFKYAERTLDGVPAPRNLFDYERQEWAMGYHVEGQGGLEVVVPTHRPALAAFGRQAPIRDEGRPVLIAGNDPNRAYSSSDRVTVAGVVVDAGWTVTHTGRDRMEMVVHLDDGSLVQGTVPEPLWRTIRRGDRVSVTASFVERHLGDEPEKGPRFLRPSVRVIERSR